MVTLEYNKEIINAIWKTLPVWNQSVDDFAPPMEEVDLAAMVESDSLLKVYLAVSGERPIGLIHFRQKSAIWSEIHCAFVKEGRGRRAVECIEEAITRELFYGVVKITASIPSCNKPACRLAAIVGFRREGINAQSFMKDGMLHDQILYGLQRREWLKGMD